MIVSIIFVVLILGVSARWNWWRLPSVGIPILMYHKIGDPPPDSKIKKLWVSERKFLRQLTYLKKNGFKSITFAEIVRGKSLPEKPVIITFDDGYENNYSLARPLLNACGFKAVFFIVADAIGKDNFWHDPATERRIPMMNDEQINELVADGHEVGSHTLSHINMDTMDETRLVHELKESKRILEKITGKTMVSFAHPYGGGAFKESINEAVKEAGYQYACSIKQGKAFFQKGRLCLHRLLIRGDDTMFDFYLNISRGKSRL